MRIILPFGAACPACENHHFGCAEPMCRAMRARRQFRCLCVPFPPKFCITTCENLCIRRYMVHDDCLRWFMAAGWLCVAVMLVFLAEGLLVFSAVVWLLSVWRSFVLTNIRAMFYCSRRKTLVCISGSTRQRPGSQWYRNLLMNI